MLLEPAGNRNVASKRYLLKCVVNEFPSFQTVQRVAPLDRAHETALCSDTRVGADPCHHRAGGRVGYVSRLPACGFVKVFITTDKGSGVHCDLGLLGPTRWREF